MTLAIEGAMWEAGMRRREGLAQARQAIEDACVILRAAVAAGERVDVSAAARALGCSRTTLYARVPELGLPRGSPDRSGD